MKPFSLKDSEQPRGPRWRVRENVRIRAGRAAKQARIEVLFLIPVTAALILAYIYRRELFGVDVPVRIAAAVLLVAVGWTLARDLGRVAGPGLLRRLDPQTAGTVGFLIRLVFVAIAVLVAVRIAGLNGRTVAIGGALTAVVFGLAAQQTLGNVFAGTVLLSARPYRIGDRIRFQGGGLAGQTEGTVSQLGLLYTTLTHGADQIMVPNAVALACAVVPLREPASVDLQARLSPGVKPSQVQALLDDRVTVETRGRPDIELISIDDEEIVVRIAAIPADPGEGSRLADEVIEAIEVATRQGLTQELETQPRKAEAAV